MLDQWFSIWGDLVLREHTASLEILLVVTVGVGVLMTSRSGGRSRGAALHPAAPRSAPTIPQTRIIQPQMSRVPQVRNPVFDVTIIILTLTNSGNLLPGQ